ncbi:signal recognition particle-docking protein FtsY [Brevibacterium paucivorans]
MDLQALIVYGILGLVVLVALGLFFLVPRKPKKPEHTLPEDTTGSTQVAPAPEEPTQDEPPREVPTEPKTRLAKLRNRLAKSNNAMGRGLLALLSRDTLDEATWEEIEDTLIVADLGVDTATELVDNLRERVRVLGTRDLSTVRALLREELIKVVDPTMDRTLRTETGGDEPSVVLVVGVNGAGKTTTVGKIARVLVASDKTVLLGAADTFRAAAAEQLTTWGERVGVETVRGPEGSDPASVAYSAVERGLKDNVDVVLIDTAGRLQNKKGLMDELGKVKKVATRPLGEGHELDEVLLVLDATTGQNGMQQAKVFAEVVNVSGIVLTKLDGTAKGGIVVAVQRELGVPVKLVGLGEGADDLAPFVVEDFVDALLED